MGATYLLVRSETKSDGRFVVDPVNTPLKVEPTNISKVNTVFQFLTLGSRNDSASLWRSSRHSRDIVVSLCMLWRVLLLRHFTSSKYLHLLRSWITGGTTIASAYSYVGGKSLTASGNKIRDTVQKEAMALRDRARRRKRRK